MCSVTMLLRLGVLLLDSCTSFFMVDVFHFLHQTQKSSSLMDGARIWYGLGSTAEQEKIENKEAAVNELLMHGSAHNTAHVS